jgi:hypothetical protein
MRKRVSFVLALLATGLLSVVALAASDRVVASFVSSAGSGVTGEVTLKAMPNGGTMVHGKVSGLVEETEYFTQNFTDGTCAAGPATEIARFRANSQGVAHFNVKTTMNLTDLKSLSVQLSSDQSLRACATVPAQ